MSNEFWYGFGVGGVFAVVVTSLTAIIRAAWPQIARKMRRH